MLFWSILTSNFEELLDFLAVTRNDKLLTVAETCSSGAISEKNNNHHFS